MLVETEERSWLFSELSDSGALALPARAFIREIWEEL